MGLTTLQIDLRSGNSLVERLHRHHKPDIGHKFTLGCVDEAGILRGAAICGRPKGRWKNSERILEVTRLVTDGTRNACSILYGAARREAIKRGYAKLITYTRVDESGISLRAAGWIQVARIKGRHWDTPSRPRADSTEIIDRFRWEAQMPEAHS